VIAARRDRAPSADPWVALAVGFAALQALIAWPMVADDYASIVVVAWLGAMLVEPGDARPAGAPVPIPWRAVGLATALVALGALAVDPVYHGYDRLVPVTTGCGLAVASSGLPGLRRHRRALLLLGSIPLLDPPLRAARALLDPVLADASSWGATHLDRAVGLPMTLAPRNLILMPSGALHVTPGCSGVLTITRLLVLVVLVIAVFPSTIGQKIALLATAVSTGFLVNVVRVAVMARSILHGSVAGFDYWHQGGGSVVLAVAATFVAGLAWWLILRETPRAKAPAPPDGSAAQC
jgi:exosortase/archaeosortase family protein